MKEDANVQVARSRAQSVATFVEVDDPELSFEYQHPQVISLASNEGDLHLGGERGSICRTNPQRPNLSPRMACSAAHRGQHAKTNVQMGRSRRKSSVKACARTKKRINVQYWAERLKQVGLDGGGPYGWTRNVQLDEGRGMFAQMFPLDLVHAVLWPVQSYILATHRLKS